MRRRVEKKDLLIALLALIAVIGMMIFLLYVYKLQVKEQEYVQQQGQHMVDIGKQNQAQAEARKEIALTGAEGATFYVYNGGEVEVLLENYRICMDGEVIYTFSKDIKVPAKETLQIDTGVETESLKNAVISFYSSDDIMLMQTIYHMLEKNKEGLAFSLAPGFYSEAIEVEIIAPENCKVYYTLDGSLPTTESMLYENAILLNIKANESPVYAASVGISHNFSYIPSTVEKGTIISAVCVDENNVIVDSVQNAYFLGIGSKAIYANMPVLSITADAELLFGYQNGIYVSGKSYEDALASAQKEKAGNYYNGTVIDAHLQYFDLERGITYSSPMLMEVVDDGYAEYPQKSIQLTANGVAAGKGSSLGTFLFGEGGSILLDAGEADYTLKIREALSRKLLENTSIAVIPMQPCTVFLNGEYWGVYLLTNPVNCEAISNLYQIDEENILLVQSWETNNKSYKEFVSYVIETDLSISENYEKVCKQMDIENYIEYVCANVYIGNSDWPNYYGYVWRSISEGNNKYEDCRWRYIWNDVEQSMGNSQLSNYSLNTYLRPMISEDKFLYSLMRNADFRQQFAETMNTISGEVFGTEVVEPIVDYYTEQYQRGIVASYTRFNGTFSMEAYNKRIVDIIKFFEERSKFILTYTRDFLSMEREYIEPQEDNLVPDQLLQE